MFPFSTFTHKIVPDYKEKKGNYLHTLYAIYIALSTGNNKHLLYIIYMYVYYNIPSTSTQHRHI